MIRVFILILNLTLSCLILYMGYELFNRLTSAEVEEKPLAKEVPLRKAPLVGQKKLPRSHYSQISQRNLFTTQASPSTPPVQKIELENLKQTDLDLKLWGTVAGNSAKAYAVIEDLKQRKQNLYRTGDDVQNAKVKMIVREKVVLTVNGKDEILEMEKMQPTGRSSRPSPSEPKPRKSAPRRTARSQTITLPKAMIDEAVKDLDKLGQEVKMQPHLENGTFDGLILTGIKPRSLFRRMGLRNGDIITRVGGEAITAEASAIQIIQALTGSSDTSAEIKRRGRVRTINYTLK